MTIHSNKELEVTRRKLRELEELAEKVAQDPNENSRIREISVQSLQRRVERLKQEISGYQTRAAKSSEVAKTPEV